MQMMMLLACMRVQEEIRGVCLLACMYVYPTCLLLQVQGQWKQNKQLAGMIDA